VESILIGVAALALLAFLHFRAIRVREDALRDAEERLRDGWDRLYEERKAASALPAERFEALERTVQQALASYSGAVVRVLDAFAAGGDAARIQADNVRSRSAAEVASARVLAAALPVSVPTVAPPAPTPQRIPIPGNLPNMGAMTEAVSIAKIADSFPRPADGFSESQTLEAVPEPENGEAHRA
jgi:hypothetical protein